MVSHLAFPPPVAGSTKQRWRFQSIQVTFQLRPARRDQARAVDVLGEQHRVGAADLVAAGDDGELGWRGEGGGHAHEVAAAELRLGGRADEQHFAVLIDKPVADQVAQDGFGGAVEGRQAVPFAGPEPTADRPFLQAQCEELLGDDVPGLRRRGDRLDERPFP